MSDDIVWRSKFPGSQEIVGVTGIQLNPTGVTGIHIADGIIYDEATKSLTVTGNDIIIKNEKIVGDK